MCSRNVSLVADANLADVDAKTYDIIVVPGGVGGAKVCAHGNLQAFINFYRYMLAIYVHSKNVVQLSSSFR